MPDSKTTGDRYAMRPIDVELYETCAKGTLAQVKALLDRGADPNAVHWLKSAMTQTEEEYCGDHDYPIFQSIENKDSRVFNLLLERGANPNYQDGYLYQPLTFAVSAGRYKIVRRLLELGNDPNLCNVDGDTPCGAAALLPNTRILKLLLDHGADPNAGGLGDRALERAVKYGTPSRIRLLVKLGCSLECHVQESLRFAPLENIRTLLECGYDPDALDVYRFHDRQIENGTLSLEPMTGNGFDTEVTDDAWANSGMPVVDTLDGERRELFLAFGAQSIFNTIKKATSMYDTFFFPTNDELFNFVSKNGPSWPLLKEYRGSRTPTPIGKLDDNVSILISTKRIKKQLVADETHFILRETRQACRKDFCRVTPFFKPKKGFLWHARLDYGEARVPLDFVVANAFQGDAFDLCSKGGVFQMRFMGLGESIKCMNGQGVVRFWDGLPVARERRDKGDPSIDHVDVVFSEAHMLNPCEDKENSAFAEFISTIENVSTETICGQPCYRIRLWSGPLEDPASFPWTLLIAKSRVPKGWTPRVGDFVNGVAAMYGTFDDKAEEGAEPTVFQPEFLSGDSIPEPPIPKKDIPKPPKGKPETEWLPRRPKEYPDAPAPRVPLPAFTDEPFKKFVTYPEYRQHIGKDLVPAPPPSRKRLREIVDEIDFKYTYMDDERWAFGRVFNVIGVRHAVLDRISGETHLWLCIPLIDIHYDSHAELMISIGNTGHVVRYTIHSNEGNWAHGEMWCEVNRDGNRDYTIHATPDAALSDIPNIKTNGFVILCAECTGNMFQAICTNDGVHKRYYAEWLLFGKSWRRGIEKMSEKRLLELCRLFLSGGIHAIQNEECWQKDQ